MSARPASTPPTQTLPDTLVAKNTLGLPDVQPKQTSALIHELELLSSPSGQHAAATSMLHQSSTNQKHDPNSAAPQTGEAEDEYTLSAYGDISLSEVIVPPPPAATHPTSSPLEPKFPQPRLRLRVRRPPMPKRRLGYTYVADPPRSGAMSSDARWPGSPRPFSNNPSGLQLQPLVPPPSAKPTTPRTQENKPLKNGGSSLEKLFDELVPRSPSIRLSPPGSPASQVIGLPQETREPKRDARQDKPKEAPWRTRLPPRLPIPKWDM